MASRWAVCCLRALWFVTCVFLCTSATGRFQRNFTEIRTVSSVLFKNASYRTDEIRLNYCGIRHVDKDAFDRMRFVRHLDLAENRVERLGVGTFDNMYNLVDLNLCCNALQRLNYGIFASLQRVETLKLHSNVITTIDSKVFHGMTALEQLELYSNRITALDGAVFTYNRNLRVISLSYNYIRHLDKLTFAYLQRLTRLHLGHNQLTDLHVEQFIYLTELSDLNLSVNSISDLPVHVFYYTKKLRTLSLAGNRLPALQDGLLRNLQQLESLHVEHNRISHIGDQALPVVRSLTEVHLEDNRLAALNTSTLASLKDATRLFLADNPWFCGCALQELHDIWLNTYDCGLPVCQGPRPVRNITWDKMPVAYFADCSPEPENTTFYLDEEQSVDNTTSVDDTASGDETASGDGSFTRVLRQITHTFDVYLGDNVSFTCDNSDQHVVWLHNGSVISAYLARPVTYRSSGYGAIPSLHLNITKATFSDAGLYTCRSFWYRGVPENNFILKVRAVPALAGSAFAWKIIGSLAIGVLALVILCGCTVWIVKKCRPRPPVYDMPLNEPGKVQAIPGINAALYDEVQLQPDKPTHLNTGVYDELKQICRRPSVDEDGYLRPAFINT